MSNDRLKIARALVKIARDIVVAGSVSGKFTNRKDIGNGVTIYDVGNDQDSMMAVRDAMIASGWTTKANAVWDLMACDDDTIEYMGDNFNEQEMIGTWKQFSAYPKRVAFKDNKLIGLCAASVKDETLGPLWFGKDGDTYYNQIPGEKNLRDDPGFLERYFPGIYEESLLLDDKPGMMNVINDGSNIQQLSSIACNATSPDVLNELFDKVDDEDVVACLASNEALPVDIMRKLAKHSKRSVRLSLARNPACPVGILRLLAQDHELIVKTYAQKAIDSITTGGNHA